MKLTGYPCIEVLLTALLAVHSSAMASGKVEVLKRRAALLLPKA